MGRLAFATSVAIMLLLVLPQSSSEEARRNVLILVDRSLSMAEEIGGERKIDIAKESIAEFINELSGVYVNVIVFPEGNACGYRKVVGWTLVDSDKPGIVSKVQAQMFPIGSTPIEETLRAGAMEFPSQGSKEIVLVSDGEETYGDDPCQAVIDLRKQGFDITVRAIGFDITDEGRAQLKCIARESGGTYSDAIDKTGLKSALRAAAGGGSGVPPPEAAKPGKDWMWLIWLILLMLVVVVAAVVYKKTRSTVLVAQPAKPVTQAAGFCPYCGSPLEAGSAFCHNCGKKA